MADLPPNAGSQHAQNTPGWVKQLKTGELEILVEYWEDLQPGRARHLMYARDLMARRQVFTHIARRVDGLAATFCGLRGNDALGQQRVFIEDMRIPDLLCPRCEAQALEELKE